MTTPDVRQLLGQVAELAATYLEQLDDRPVAGPVDLVALRAALGGPLPDEAAADAWSVVKRLAVAAAPGLVASNGRRYFGFVTGGSLPAALGADWLTSAWDQNAALSVMSPAASVAEAVVGEWLVELLGLPAGVSFGLVTGCQMANVVGLAAARGTVLADAGVDVAEVGLAGAPPLRVVVGAERHTTIDVALRYLGIGRRQVTVVAADEQGRMLPSALAAVLAELGPGPTIVCAQAGCVNTGAFDPLREICQVARRHGAWVHVDGAFGLWAAASPRRQHLVAGVELADSWATDGHKWLNVPYDAGLVFVSRPEAHRAAMAMDAAYLPKSSGLRDGTDWAPESSRRARAFTVWAALQSLGRRGVADLVDRCCDLAELAARELAAVPGVEVVNEVVLNQVLLRFDRPGGSAGDHDGDAVTAAVIEAVQREGDAWFGSSTWQGRLVARLSVSGWPTEAADIERTVASVRRALLAAD